MKKSTKTSWVFLKAISYKLQANRGQALQYNSGQAAITATLFFIALMFAITYGLSSLALQIEKTTRTNISGKKSYFIAEAGEEDVVYRLIEGKTVDATETLYLDGHVATTTITTIGSDRQVTSQGSVSKNIRNVYAYLTSSIGASFSYGIQAGEGGLIMENTSEVLGNVFTNGPIIGNNSPVIRGDAISAGPSGLFEDHHATGTVYAHTIWDSTIERDAHYQTISGSTVLGVSYPGSPDEATSTLPISDELVEQWKADAEAGGVISSPCPYKINNNATLGPVKINCDLEISGTGFTVTLNGTVWISGNLQIKNSPTIKIASSLGSGSVVLVADNESNRLTSSKIESNNSAVFQGSGSPGSYVFLLSQNESSEQGGSEIAIDVANSSRGDYLVYAGHGEILIQNSVKLKEVTAYKIHTKNSAQITYETGLASLLFTSGPTGGYTIINWKETE